MRPSFNTAGPCFPGEHYMLPPERRLGRVLELIDERKYFTLHSGRQTGKTTCAFWLADHLNASGRYRAAWVDLQTAREQPDLDRALPIIVSELDRASARDLPSLARPALDLRELRPRSAATRRAGDAEGPAPMSRSCASGSRWAVASLASSQHDCVYIRDMRAGWIAVVGLVSACSKPHVMLPAVTPNLTPEQRVQMFQDLYATRENTSTTTFCGGRGGGCSTSVEKTLYLANGTQIYHPEDLLPVVAPDSITARAVRDVHVQRRKALVYGGVSFVSAVGFVAIGFSKFGTGETSFSTSEKVGLLAVISGLLVGGLGTWYHNSQAAQSWGEANDGYNASLAQRLGVCTSGFAVVPCESATTPATTPTRALPPMLGPAPAPALAPPGVTRPSGR